MEKKALTPKKIKFWAGFIPAKNILICIILIYLILLGAMAINIVSFKSLIAHTIVSVVALSIIWWLGSHNKACHYEYLRNRTKRMNGKTRMKADQYLRHCCRQGTLLET